MVVSAFGPNYDRDRPAEPHRGDARDRCHMLLADEGDRWAEQLPRLLEPQGVRAFRTANVDEAIALMQNTPMHLAVVDLGLGQQDGPRGAQPGSPEADRGRERLPGGLKLLQVIQRLEDRPRAIVVVRGRRFDPRVDNHVLTEALKLDAFSVLDRPVQLEQMLVVLRRALERYFGGTWPSGEPGPDSRP